MVWLEDIVAEASINIEARQFEPVVIEQTWDW